MSNIGDWAEVVRGFTPPWIWRGALTLVGGVAYYCATRWAMGQLGRHLRAKGAARVVKANRYTLTAYAAGGAIALAGGVFEPGGAFVVLISAVGAAAAA